MEKKKNCRKEVFESLRLDLQEFAPQEFVATCYLMTIPCSSKGYVSTNPTTNKAESHPSNHIDSKHLYLPNRNDEPQQDEINSIVSGLSGYSAPVYSASSRNFHSSTPVEGFYFKSDSGDIHFSQWASISVVPVVSLEHPNVSG